MTHFATKQLPATPDARAPDGSAVRILPGLAAGGMAHLELGPGETSRAVTHRTVEEIWYFVAGRWPMWRQQGERSEVVLGAIGVTMPPSPREDVATEVPGRWPPTT